MWLLSLRNAFFDRLNKNKIEVGMYVPASFGVWKYSLLYDKIKKICTKLVQK